MSSQSNRSLSDQQHHSDRKQRTPQPGEPAIGRAPAPLDPVTRRRAVADPGTLSPAGVIALQRSVGNRAVRRLIRPKLVVGPPGDLYEQEADRVADLVLSTPAPPASDSVQRQDEDDDLVQASPLAGPLTPAVQRQDDEDEEFVQASGLTPTVQRQDDEEDLIQAKSARQPESGDGSFEAGAGLESRLAAHRGGGRPLPDELRAELEPKFGSDFGGVRVHTGPDSVRMNRELGARAFTHGTDIHFGEGKYAPGSSEGKKLLAHELTHVVQQTGARPLRRKAEPALRRIRPTTIGAAGGRIQRGLLGRLFGRKKKETPPEPEPAVNSEPAPAPEAAEEGEKSRTEVALGYLRTFFSGIGLILKEGTLRSLAAGAQVFKGAVYVAQPALQATLGAPGAVAGGALVAGGAIVGGVLAGVGTLVSALVATSAAVVGGLIGGLVLTGAKLADLITSAPARIKSWWKERKARKRQAGKTANVPLQEKASNVAVKLNKRQWKIERYFSFQQMDYDTLSQHAQEAQEGLSPELVSAAESHGKGKAGSDGAVSPAEASALVPEGPAAEPLLKQLAKLATLFKYREESDRRVKKAALYHAETSRFYQFALGLYDKIVATVKGGQDPEPLYQTDVDRAWDTLEIAEGYRQELKADKAQVKSEASKDGDKYGRRSESFARKQGKKLLAALKGTVVSVATLGQQTVRSRTVGGGYRVEVETVKRSDQIREAVARAMEIWSNTAGQGAGLGAPRLYAILKAISEILGLLKPAFTAIGVISTGLSVLFSIVGLLPVAGGFVGVAALCTAINLALTLAKLAFDLLLAIWSKIASAVAKDPRARINTAMKSRQQAVQVASGLVTGAASGFGVATYGGLDDALNPAAAYGRTVDQADPTGIVMGTNDRPMTIIPGESGVGAVDKANSAITVDRAIRYGGLAGGKASIKAGTTVAYPMGGSHLLDQAADRENRAFENLRGKGSESGDGGPQPEGEGHEAEGAGRMAEAQEKSAAVVAKVESQLGEAEGAPEKTRKKGKFRRAMEGAASLLASITVIPAFLKDLAAGIRAAWQDRKKGEES